MTGKYANVSKILNQHASTGSKLTVRIFTPDSELDESVETYVLLEGDREALQFLADAITKHLGTDVCNLSLHPTGAGSAHFAPESNAGIYIHQLPCDHGPIKMVV